MCLCFTLPFGLLSQSVLFHSVLVCISLLLNSSSKNLFFNQHLLLFQVRFTLSLGNLCIHSCHLNRLLLLLLLNSISSICLCLFNISSTLQFALGNRKLILTLRNCQISMYLRIISFLLGSSLSNSHITLGNSLADRSILADFCRIICTQIDNQTIIVNNILDIAAQDADTQLFHILSSLFQHFVREGVTVDVNLLQIKRTDNLTHITFKRILQTASNIRRLHIQKVSCCQVDTVFLINDNLGNCINLNIDKIIGGNALAGFDVNGHLPQIQHINALQKRDFKAAYTNKDTRILRQTGNNIRHVRWCFYITGLSRNNK